MTYGASWIPVDDKERFARLGFMGTNVTPAITYKKDSKQLSAEKREKLFSSICNCEKVQINFKVTIISAQEISENMQKMYNRSNSALILNSNKVNLNQISHNSAIDLVRYALANGFNITEV